MEIVDVHRHAAEKLHAMMRDFGDRENTRVRDLVDLVILIEHGMLDPAPVAAATRQVFSERDAVEPPAVLPPLPESWPARYERLAADHDLATQLFPAGVALVRRLWAEMFPMQETLSAMAAPGLEQAVAEHDGRVGADLGCRRTRRLAARAQQGGGAHGQVLRLTPEPGRASRRRAFLYNPGNPR